MKGTRLVAGSIGGEKLRYYYILSVGNTSGRPLVLHCDTPLSTPTVDKSS